MSGAINPLTQYAFVAWCLVKAQGQLYLYITIQRHNSEELDINQNRNNNYKHLDYYFIGCTADQASFQDISKFRLKFQRQIYISKQNIQILH
jgi:hypothetical protein